MKQTTTSAEEAVLGAIIIRNENFHDAATQLSADHFTTGFHKRVWSAIKDRMGSGDAADEITLSEALPDDADAIFALTSGCTTSRNVATYVKIVRQNWRVREGTQIAQRLLASLRGDEDGVDEAIGELLNLNSSVTECEFTGKQAMLMAWEQAQTAYQNGGKLPGITTGLSEMDDILGGWHNSDLTLIGGRPAMGKTAFLLGLAEASSAAGVPTGLISAEQPTAQIGVRRMSLASGVGAASIRAGRIEDEDWSKITAGLSNAKDRPIWIYDRSAITLDELIGIGRKWKHTHNIGILFIDYAQRITVPGADRITEVSLIARGLKNMARNLNIPVIALGQVKAEVERRTDRRPLAGDLANSDELTREADQILMLYRDEVYNRDSKDRGIAEILVEKNRHGPTGFKQVAFHGETMRFANLARERWAA